MTNFKYNFFFKLTFLREFVWIDITWKDEGMKYSDNNYEFNFVEILSFLIFFLEFTFLREFVWIGIILC
jgi:hypothetical protein